MHRVIHRQSGYLTTRVFHTARVESALGTGYQASGALDAPADAARGDWPRRGSGRPPNPTTRQPGCDHEETTACLSSLIRHPQHVTDAMIDEADTSGLGLAALALATASLAHGVRHGRISLEERSAIYKEARALVHDPAGFVIDLEVVRAANDFLSVSDALSQPDQIGTSASDRPRRTA